MAGGSVQQFAVPRGQRFDDTANVADELIVWRGLDPKQSWNAAIYNSAAATTTVHKSAIKTEELSTAASDKTNLQALRGTGTIFFDWKMAEFTVGEARRAGYIAMRDPINTQDVVFYDRSNCDGKASTTVAKALARIARIV